jgi:hypothetical protein
MRMELSRLNKIVYTYTVKEFHNIGYITAVIVRCHITHHEDGS